MQIPTKQITQMRREILEIPDAVERLLTNGSADIQTTAKMLRDRDPLFLVTIARGSSDHVSTYLKYASELMLGVPVASIGPSTVSIFGASLKLDPATCLAVSQSGKSPDIVALTRAATVQGAHTIAITNDPTSPLAEVSQQTLYIHAGSELSIAATKTFVTSAVTGLLLLAEWQGDAEIISALHALPEQLARAVQIDWPEMRAALKGQDSLFCLGRGPTLAMSNEAALKFKETCQLHAESYSSAEVLHGPVSIVDRGFPILALTAKDNAEPALVDVADQLTAKGATVFVTSDTTQKTTQLEIVRTNHAMCDPIALIVSFYAMVEQVAVARGINPDAPLHLKKVTETL